jgi:hypothetical protein
MAVWHEHFADASLDASRFGSAVAGTGTVVEAGTRLTLTLPTVDSAAIAYLLRNVDPAEAAVYVQKVRLSAVSSGGAAAFLSVLDKATAPTPTTSALWNPAQRINCFQVDAGGIAFGYAPTSGADKYWNGSAWTTSYAPAVTLTTNRWVILVFIHTATAWKYVLLDGSGSVELAHTDWVAWADVKASTTLWAWWGGPYTDYYTATLDADFFRFGNEALQAAFYNGQASNGSAYQGPRIGRAISLDGGRLFVRDPADAPVVSAANFPGGESVTDVVWPWCVLDGSTYYLWAITKTAATGFTKLWCLTSDDGITWTRSGDAAKLTIGAAGQFDAVSLAFATVYKDETDADPDLRWKIYYGGIAADGKVRLGLATCAAPTDASYTKYGSNPILDVGGAEAFDEQDLVNFCIVPDGPILRMFYGGSDAATGHYQVGEATSEDWLAWTKLQVDPILARRSTIGTDITTAASGATAIVVTDTSLFVADEWVILVDAETATLFQLNRVESIETGTGITLVSPLEHAFTGGKLRSAWWGSVTPSAVTKESGLWRMRPTAFQQVTPSAGVCETVGYAEGSAHDALALVLIDFSALPLGCRWDQRAGNAVGASAENLALVTLPVTLEPAFLEDFPDTWAVLEQLDEAFTDTWTVLEFHDVWTVIWRKLDDLFSDLWTVVPVAVVSFDFVDSWTVRASHGMTLSDRWRVLPPAIVTLYSSDVQLPTATVELT